MVRVQLINPPNLGNSFRGVGFYGQNLTAALEKIPDLDLTDQNPQVIHYLYFDPFFLTLPPFHRARTVVTIFDLTPFILPTLFPRGLRGEIKWQIQKRLVSQADAIITISQSAKADIARIIGVPKEKILVTYLAAGKSCRPKKVKQENFILYIGDVNPNKNLSSLIRAMVQLPDEKLVLVGKAFTDMNLPETRAIRAEIKNLGLEKKVSLPGFISEEEKVSLLNRAAVYVQPSIYEGFGLPVLEAMACGTPVVCGRNSSLPEIAGEAAVFADVSDSSDLARKILEAKKGKLIQKGLAQAAKFSWEKTARETARIYEDLCHHSRL
ncbi:MAG: glycosyltransferase family 4 protein [Patescibacteria group bacterium]|nr:glycosyltransferase family 4 protein [Patescibacteria group bacterium]MCL5431569.1 glycosyltransferase family 4 protein [Patescibacteria group bacterium]